MDLKTLKVGELPTNCYIGVLGNGDAFVVDPGDEAARIIEELEKTKGINLRYVLLTHGHYDHVLAVDDLAIKYPQASVVIHEEDIKLFQELSAQGIFVKKILHNPKAEVVAVSEGSTLKFGDEIIKIIHTPGHTKGSVCYYLGDTLFSGDTLFYHTYGRIDLPWSDPGSMKESIDKLLHLPDKTRVLPGHGKETTIGEEQKFEEVRGSEYF
ncbi:MAG: MBL fold metallo-hydrolase [Patescibacteria group bacterium]|nr:MBL fold metallo-hydrolase [Patescibacteria group bacterium]